MTEATLTENIEAYELIREMLERDHFGEWVVIHARKVSGYYQDFEAAADEAVEQFGRGPYLIRQIGVPAPPLPASVLFHTSP